MTGREVLDFLNGCDNLDEEVVVFTKVKVVSLEHTTSININAPLHALRHVTLRDGSNAIGAIA